MSEKKGKTSKSIGTGTTVTMTLKTTITNIATNMATTADTTTTATTVTATTNAGEGRLVSSPECVADFTCLQNEDSGVEDTSRFSVPDEPTSARKKTVRTVTTQNSQVFFMIGCQRSGSNWLRTMLSEREDLIAPHPPHIMRDFMSRLGKYGDLTVQENLKVSLIIRNGVLFYVGYS